LGGKDSSTIDKWQIHKTQVRSVYNGAGWQAVASPTTNDLESVVMVSTSKGWAVGLGGTILHYGNGTWRAVVSPTTNDSALQR
jgi:hypothetical protein